MTWNEWLAQRLYGLPTEDVAYAMRYIRMVRQTPVESLARRQRLEKIERTYANARLATEKNEQAVGAGVERRNARRMMELAGLYRKENGKLKRLKMENGRALALLKEQRALEILRAEIGGWDPYE